MALASLFAQGFIIFIIFWGFTDITFGFKGLQISMDILRISE